MSSLIPLYTHLSGVITQLENIRCPQVIMEKVSFIYRMRGRRRSLETMTLLIINAMCLVLILKIFAPEHCEKITSPKSVREAEPPESTLCEQNMSATKIKGFFDFPLIIQDFLYYRHCRQFPMLLNLPNKCNIPKGSGETFFLLAIKSSPKNYERRSVLRKTWAAERWQNGIRIRTVFLTGTTGVGFEKKRINKLLKLENNKYKDILQWNFTESFYNLTLKQILFLDWMQNWCPTADYFLNGDDDVFANTENMVDFLKGQGNVDGSRHLYIGQLLLDSEPIRDNSSKYFIPEVIEAANMYAPYCSGGGYLFSRFTGRAIYQMSQSIPLMPIDDVYMGMCLKQAGLTPSDHQGVWADGLIIPSDKMDIYDPCHYKDIILGHKFLPHQIFLLWNEIHRKDLNCAKKELSH
ncbi:N-acetyllactosaminide beta-1,3-N-acetylglucosaminyltransferase 3-like [Tachysurus ichikawai]